MEICTNSKKSPKRISWSLFFFPSQFKLKDTRQIHTYCMYLCIIFYTRKKTIIHRVKDDRNISSKQQNPEQEKSNTGSPHIVRFHFVRFTLCVTALLIDYPNVLCRINMTQLDTCVKRTTRHNTTQTTHAKNIFFFML